MPTYTGNNGGNTINGSNSGDTIYGLGGNDILFGRGGNDTIWGGTGNDHIEGNDGNDTLNGEDGNDEISGGTGNDTLTGGAGNDDMSGDDNDDNLSGGAGNDELSGGKGDDILNGDADDDEIFGDDGNDFVLGGAGYDILYGGAGIDVMDGGDQDDQLSGGTGNDVMTGGSGNDIVSGDENDDNVSGGTGNDALSGGSGNDILTGGAGLDFIDGGSGTDTAVYTGSVFAYSFYQLGPLLGVVHNGPGGPGSGADGADLLVWVEKLQFSDVTIDLTQNNAPIAVDDTASTNENAGTYSSGSASVLDNDFDFEHDPLHAIGGAFAGIYGTLTLNANGTYSYVLNANAQTLAQGQTGTDIFGYTVSDGSLTDTGQLVISITGINDAPVANGDSAAGTENQVLTINVLANDTDVDNGHVLTVISASVPAGRGTASVVGNQVQFNPGTDFDHLAQGATQIVTVNYAIKDEFGATSSSTVAITVTGTNDAPVAHADTASGTENQILTINVLGNDTDVDDGHVLTVTSASAPSGQGSASVVGNQVRFDPGTSFDHLAQGATQLVTVSYTMQDEYGASSSSTATITVTGTNDAPVAVADAASGNENQILTINVLGNDTDVDDGNVLTLTSASAPAGQGSASVVGNQVRFDPGTSFDHLAAGATQVVTLSYAIRDEFGATSSSTVAVTVTGTNDAPVANADTASGTENQILTVNVLANDTDVDDGHVLTLTSASAPSGLGSASVVGNQVQFNPGTDFDHLAAGATQVVTVNYAIQDEFGATSASTIAITVTGTNDGPVANPDTASGTENQILTINVLGNDTDVDDGHVLTLSSATAPSGQGSASVVGNQVQFNPGSDFDHLAAGATQIVTVAYSIHDDQGATSASTVAITVTGTNDGPVANADTATTDENTAVLVDVLANDTDADDGHILTVAAASAPSGQGSASIVSNQVQFDPGTDFDYLADGESALVVLNYTTQDEHGAQSLSTLTITVEGRDEGAVIIGTDDGETLTGTPGNDTIDALGGDDNVSGLAGADQINGGDGFDQLSGDAGNDVIDGGNDDDLALGGDGNDQLLGQAGNDNLFGGDGSDQLSGGDGFDQLSGDAGNDVLDGGNDDDFLSGGDGNDQLLGQAGNDGLAGESGNDQLSGGDGNDSLEGGDGNDSLTGGDGDDFLIDSSGTNSFAGGIGNDLILAGASSGAQTIDGGDGNDTIRVSDRYFASTITTGAGRDTVALLHADLFTDPSTKVTVTDFTTGAGGDMFDLSGDGALLSLLSGWDGSANPFGAGFLRLEQSGANTLLQWDQDGAAAGATWQTLVVFQNANAGAFTDANFTPGYNPDGSAAAGQTITGTDAGETLTGTIGSDTIDALGGDDNVSGLAGPDQINGGDGFDQLNGGADNDVVAGGNDDDVLSGGDGNDQLLGQAGNDSLLGENGDDQLSGGDGNDGFDGGAGNDSLDGGDGDDSMVDLSGTNSFAGGLGNDLIVAAAVTGAQTIDGGDGNDTIRVSDRYFASTITTGTGSDTIALLHADLFTDPSTKVTVTDFTAGAGGDMFDLSGDGALLSLLSGWDGSANPFGAGFLRLEQSGANTLLQWDQDGAAGGAAWETLVVFQNAEAAAFTDANFTPGYDPDGSAPAGQTITATDDGETLTGTIGDDTIYALGGDDAVSGLAGADQINGGDGFDLLSGGADNDVIDGGNDDDSLSGGDGNDQLLGQAGNDSLLGENGDDQLSGGDGNDSLDGGAGNNVLDGGDGDDFLSGGLGSDVLIGGAGNDTFRQYDRYFGSTITTGSGSDTIELLHADLFTDPSTVVTVTDFTTGGGGDMVQLSGEDGSLLSLLSGWDGSSNPFDSGFLRLEQSGADTLLEWDQNGAAGGAAWQTLIVFQNASAGDFTDANFTPGYDPDGSAPSGQTITGTDEGETLTGTIGGDTINALGGVDVVYGGAGADQIDGGDDAGFLHGEADNDTIVGGSDDDFLWGGDGNDQLSGQAGYDALFGENGDDQLSGGDGNDGLDGGNGNDAIVAGDGDDFLSGGSGSDVLTGGDGADIFDFRTASQGPDQITDFASGIDKIRISADGFGGGLTSGGDVVLVSGATPHVSGDAGQFLFDTDDGRLLWDADGNGSGAAILVATLTNAPPLTASDFIVG